MTASSTYLYSGPGAVKAAYSIVEDRLVVELPGAQVGKRLHELSVPLDDIRGFHVVGRREARGADAQLGEAIMVGIMHMSGELCLSYTCEGRVKRKKAILLNVDDPSFSRFMSALAVRCPSADLRAMDTKGAEKRMGFTSDTQIALMFILGVFAVLAAYLAYRAWLR